METGKIHTVYKSAIEKGAFRGRTEDLVRLLEMLELHGNLASREREELLRLADKVEAAEGHSSAHGPGGMISLLGLRTPAEKPHARRKLSSYFSFLRAHRDS
ncbi:MAG: hypothetical protein ACM3QS_18300 [Bacteroidota bacterium]